jgi:hypothetical protein
MHRNPEERTASCDERKQEAPDVQCERKAAFQAEPIRGDIVDVISDR